MASSPSAPASDPNDIKLSSHRSETWSLRHRRRKQKRKQLMQATIVAVFLGVLLFAGFAIMAKGCGHDDSPSGAPATGF